MRTFFFLAALMLIAFALVVHPFQPTPAANAETLTATYSQATLHVTIPYQAAHAGPGQLTVEVLNPEGEVLARAAQEVGANQGKGWWQEDLKLTKSLETDDLD